MTGFMMPVTTADGVARNAIIAAGIGLLQGAIAEGKENDVAYQDLGTALEKLIEGEPGKDVMMTLGEATAYGALLHTVTSRIEELEGE